MRLKISLFRGTDENHKQLHGHVPQNPPKERQLIMLAVIHDEEDDAKLSDAKVMLYQELLDTNAYWIRKENSEDPDERTNYAETLVFTGADALNGFELSAQKMLNRLTTRQIAIDAAECGTGC